jgi:hypothetical protein
VFDFSIERFGGSICGTVVVEVEYLVTVVVKSSGNDVERMKSGLACPVIPSGKIQPCSGNGGTFVEFHAQAVSQGVCLPDVGILLKENFSSLALSFRPVVA